MGDQLDATTTTWSLPRHERRIAISPLFLTIIICNCFLHNSTQPNAAPTEKLVENIDAVWDDGVAPELCLDFDCQHVDSTEGLMWWLGGFGFFATLYQVVKATKPEDKKPCVNRIHNDVVVVGNPLRGSPGASAVE